MSKADASLRSSMFLQRRLSPLAFSCSEIQERSRPGRRKLHRMSHRLASAAMLAASMALTTPAGAADADNGGRIAQSRCAACHVVVAPNLRPEVADAPPF